MKGAHEWRPAILHTPVVSPLIGGEDFRQRVLARDDGEHYTCLWFLNDTQGGGLIFQGLEPRRRGERFQVPKDRVEVLDLAE